MKKAVVLSVFVLMTGCGGSKVRLNNGTGMILDSVTLTIAGNSETWYNVEADKTIGSDLVLPDSSVTIMLEWDSGGDQWSMEYATIDSAGCAKSVSIMFSIEQMSVNYSF
jgi:hypothetical protein